MKKLKKFSLGSIVDSFKTRSFRAGGYSVAATAILLVMVIIINLLVSALPSKMTKFDITDNQLYSISEQTKTVIKSIKKEITVYWILTEGNEDNYLKSLLNLVQEQSDLVKVVQKDTNIHPNFASAYTLDTVYPNSLVVECGEKYRYLNYAGDIYTQDYADYYTTGTYTQYFNGEGALVSAIDYVTSDELPRLYALTGHGEAELSATFAAAVKNQNIDMAELSLLNVEAVPADADGILINAPKSDISATELEMLRSYTSKGGNLMLITDGHTGESTTKNLDALMADYGMSSVTGMVVETDRNHFFSMQQQAIPVALLPIMNEHAIMDPLINGNYFVMLYGAHGIKVAEDLPAELVVTELMSTSYGAFSKLEGEHMADFNRTDKDIQGPFGVANLATKNADTAEESHVIWVGSSTLVDDGVNDYVSGGNMDLFLNMLSYLCDPEAAQLTIHAKPVSNTKYLTMGSTTVAILTAVVLVVIPLGYLACGLTTWIRRKRQ